jgi:pyruvoyl-dependent arginine decarboxylase (PvlArgDC)
MLHKKWILTMKCMVTLLTGALLTAAGPAWAQVDTTSAAVNAQRLANANGVAAAQAHAEVSMNAEQKDQYARDMAAYSDALRAQHRAEMADVRQYERQQRAYAGAMFDWRIQVEACRHGSTRACTAATPNPADYR